MFAAGTAYDRDGPQGLAGPHGFGAPRPGAEAGAQGELPAGPHGDSAGLPAAGAQGLAVPCPEEDDAGPHGLAAGCPDCAGPQGLPGPHGLRAACASRIGFSAAATGVGAGAVAIMAAASVDRLPAKSADFMCFVCMHYS